MAQGPLIGLEPVLRRILGRRIPAPGGPGWPRLPAGVVLREGRLVPAVGGFLARMDGSAAAVALGKTIVVSPDVRLTPGLLRHELAHVRQWKEDPLFPLRYAVEAARCGYRGNRYERDAREAERSLDDSPI
jgi:hypothetical protein